MDQNKLNIMSIGNEFKSELRKLYGGRLKKLVLYGSYARGDYTPDSDIDIMVVLKGKVDTIDEIFRMSDITTDLELKYEVLISGLAFSENDYLNKRTSLFLNVKKEGIEL